MFVKAGVYDYRQAYLNAESGVFVCNVDDHTVQWKGVKGKPFLKNEDWFDGTDIVDHRTLWFVASDGLTPAQPVSETEHLFVLDHPEYVRITNNIAQVWSEQGLADYVWDQVTENTTWVPNHYPTFKEVVYPAHVVVTTDPATKWVQINVIDHKHQAITVHCKLSDTSQQLFRDLRLLLNAKVGAFGDTPALGKWADRLTKVYYSLRGKE